MTEPPIKPWHRLRNWFLAGTLLLVVAIAWMAIETRRVHTAEPNISTDYRAVFRDYVSQHVGLGDDDGAAAWRVLHETLEQIDAALAEFTMEIESRGDFEPRFEYDEPSPDFHYVTSGARIPADAKREREAIAMLHERGLFDQIDRFIELAPAYNPEPADDLMISELMALLQQTRRFVQARTASMRVALYEGDMDELAHGAKQALATSQSLSLQPGIINMLVGHACVQLILQELRNGLMEADFDEATCYRILEAMEQFSPPSLQFVFEGERAVLNDLLQHTFSDDGRGGGHLLYPALFDEYIFGQAESELRFDEAFLTRFILLDRRQTAAMLDGACDILIAQAAKPHHERDMLALDEYIGGLTWRHKMVASVVSHFDRLLSTDAHTRTMIEGTKVMLALAIHRDRHGTYPESLDMLAPDILPQVPTDPINGKTFGYRLLDDDEHGRPYLLYSFGLDGEDNDGVMQGNGMEHLAMSNEVDGAGFDFVLNQPRHSWLD